MPYSLLEAKPIEELCKVVDCEHKTAPYVDESEYLVVRTSNVRDGQLVMESMKYTTLEGYNEWTSRAVPEHGDVLFTREAPAGESCLVPSDTKVCMGQRMVMLRPHKSEVDPVFLSMILNTERTKNDIYRLSIGSTVSRINIADIKKLKVASPPLPEQQKIAKILSTWDKAINTTERLIDNSTQQKKALMQQLLTGKKRLLDDEGKRFESEWAERAVSSLGKIYSGGTPSTSNTEYWDGDINWITPTDITKQDSRYINSSLRKITLEGLENSSAKLVPAGSLLICTRATIGAMAITSNEMCTNQGFKNIVPNSKTNIVFVYYLLTYNKHRMISKASGSTFLELSKTSFESMRFRMPPLKEQQKIATVLANADKEIELLEQQLADL
ncbi:restriction endonuclease subunit S [Psychrobacter fulvigenes]|uniref:restriction endonuclease subunit S n=1 Tax=Psychrobacter fulvigenes TaxID=533323 RepID=UPI00191A5F75|nr:restriction endonuclease subunit S [Psychrobacter fulvigenes]